MGTQITTIWSEIDPTFVPDSSGRLKIVENVESARAAISNILHTRKGERVMLPEFGSTILDILFEPLNATSIKLLSRTVKEDIERWDDRVIIEGVDIYPDPDQSSLSLKLLFRIRGFTNIFKYETLFRGEV